uniref:Fatty acyl-CoA reductase n=1 Tax=Setaria italica TaxID=4555 RepID=A0A0Q3TS17_SETIT
LGTELFCLLRDKHGADFQSFIREKISPLAGDMRDENLGLESTRAKQLFEEIDIIVNGAAITDFYERYDVALASNTFGTVHVCNFAKQCSHLKLLLHVSTESCGGLEAQGMVMDTRLTLIPIASTWRLYLFSTHIPAVLKVAAHMKKEGSA